MTDEERIDAAALRYGAAAHAVQSGVAAELEIDPTFCSHKHMRTGVDMSKADMSGLANLLIKKGVITLVEYHEAMADGMEQEKRRWEEHLSMRFGKSITLG